MKIKAVKLYEGGFMTQPFAMGGEDGAEQFDPKVRYRSTLQVKKTTTSYNFHL